MKKKKTVEKYREHKTVLLYSAAAIICAVLLICTIVILLQHSNELKDQACVNAELYTSEVNISLNEYVQDCGKTAELAAQKAALINAKDVGMTESPEGVITWREDVKSADSRYGFLQRIRDLQVDDERFNRILFTRFFEDGTEYDSVGNPFDVSKESRNILKYANTDKTVFCGYLSDWEHSTSVVAFCTPVPYCDYADTLVVFFPVSAISEFATTIPEAYFEKCSVMTLCAQDGEVLSDLNKSVKTSEVLSVSEHNNIYEVLSNKINDKNTIDSMRNMVVKSETGSFPVTVNGEEYILSVASTILEGESFAIVGMYRAIDVYSSGYQIISTILGAFVVFLFLLIVASLFFIFGRRHDRYKMLTVNDFDKELKCPSKSKFEREAASIIARNKGSMFAVVIMSLKHFSYLNENSEKDDVLGLLRHITTILKRSLLVDETYGYMGDGQFLLLLHYRDHNGLYGRLQMNGMLAAKYTGRLAGGYHIDFVGGIYEEDLKITEDVGKMIEYANTAKLFPPSDDDLGTYRVYTDRMESVRLKNEYIEVHMKSALEANDFKVFYQAKYNLETDKPDGAEALVRWYNPEKQEYMSPGDFMPLFEANGFIVDLDHYIYEQVCIYLEEASAHGQVVYPISVNVSRVTASRNDFIDYYLAIKKKHKIPDGILTLEFTESFAYENYDSLRSMVNTLHDRGFKCSIDDFGSGFSSYNILKELPMDEIKLDQFFIKEGITKERDAKILESVITIGRTLNMKVTQEGVETKDQLEMLRALGCDVIQGYYYSKPLALSDYVEFITNASKSQSFVERMHEIY